mgnify:CR=1 FL=1
MKEVKDGKLTGKTINKKIDGCATWTPGDKMAFDALSGFTDVVSTKEFVNQMATTLVGIKEWALLHDKEVISILKQTYGYDQFRGEQEEIINYLIEGGSSFVLMPTGSGKSLCYQIPSLCREGVGVIVSPLIALMQDQIKLKQYFLFYLIL